MKRILLSACLAAFISCSFDNDESELCFIGDSITYLWDLEYYFPGYILHKHAVSGAGLKQLDTWDVSDCSGKATVLLIGTNDIGLWTPTEPRIDELRTQFKNRFLQSAKRINGNPLYVLSILPRNEWGEQDPLVNENIKVQNEILREALEQELPNSEFIDVYDMFIRSDLEIREDLFKDGLHPNDYGYEVLAKKIQDAL